MNNESPESKEQTDHPVRHQTRMGAGMIVVMWLMLFVLLVVFFSDVLDKQNNPNQNIATRFDAGVREVVLVRNKFGHYVTDGFINNHPVVFMLDTGATGVSVPEALADKLNMKRGQSIRMQTANGSVLGYISKIGVAGIGGIQLENIPAIINAGNQGEEILLGMSFLKHIEFTQRGDTLTLRQYVSQ